MDFFVAVNILNMLSNSFFYTFSCLSNVYFATIGAFNFIHYSTSVAVYNGIPVNGSGEGVYLLPPGIYRSLSETASFLRVFAENSWNTASPRLTLKSCVYGPKRP
jgi:hypothetical protein